jgi:hypothetical protein
MGPLLSKETCALSGQFGIQDSRMHRSKRFPAIEPGKMQNECAKVSRGESMPYMTFRRTSFFLAALLFGSVLHVPAVAYGQQEVATVSDSNALPDAPAPEPQENASASPAAPGTQNAAAASGTEGKQTKRILFIVPNFRAVSADEKLPRQTVKDKFMTATMDSVDYSSFLFVGIQAGIAQAGNTYPEFHQGAAGYARYYWHTFADTLDENLWVEFLLPTVLRQDSRLYTKGRGGFTRRLAYSASRAFITRTDSGRETFNASEIFGAGTAAGISSLYYPSSERTFTKTYQRWITSVSIDDATFVFKEFWPDINNKFFHQKD